MFKLTVNKLTYIGHLACPVLRKIAEYIIESITGTKPIDIICRNTYPLSITFTSVVNMLRNSGESRKTAKENKNENTKPAISPSPSTWDTLFASLFPQNWAA
ncbi:hypothetical protein D3C75_998710 [compost metagenome]